MLTPIIKFSHITLIPCFSLYDLPRRCYGLKVMLCDLSEFNPIVERYRTGKLAAQVLCICMHPWCSIWHAGTLVFAPYPQTRYSLTHLLFSLSFLLSLFILHKHTHTYTYVYMQMIYYFLMGLARRKHIAL